MDSSQPITHLDMAVLKHGPHLDREFFSAGVALVEARTVALAGQAPGATDNAALRQTRPFAQIRAST